MVAFSRDRRRVIAGSAALACAMRTAPVMAQGRRPMFTAGDPTLGLQIYTLGPEALADLDKAFATVRGIGYRSVELLMFCNHKPREVRAALDRAGLQAHSTQIAFQDLGTGYDLTSHLAATMDAANEVGLQCVVTPIFNFPKRFGKFTGPEGLTKVAAAMTVDDWKAYADQLNATGAQMKARGLTVGHHNHNVDFTPVAGVTGYDLIARNIDPKLVTLELDIGWVAAAGLDPIAVLNRYARRFSMMHVKDIKATTRPNYAFQQDPAVIGQGSLDIPAILQAGRKAGVRAFYVEQEPPFTIPREEAARESYAFLTASRA